MSLFSAIRFQIDRLLAPWRQRGELMALGRSYRRHARLEPGHFYSPIVSQDTIDRRREQLWPADGQRELPGIDFDPDGQVERMAALAAHAPAMPYGEEPRPGLRYHFENNYFRHSDAILLHAMLLHHSPARVVEVGSGWSSALMVDVNDTLLQGSMALTFIEPHPERLLGLLGPGHGPQVDLVQLEVQDVPLNVFDRLEANDFLFIDSSHVLKTGSDVNHLLFNVLPRLRPGVIVHFHDVFEGFEYPEDWVRNGFNWNEAYALRAFLMYNKAFRMLLHGAWLHRHRPQTFAPWPMAARNTGGSLWLQRNF